MERLMGFVALWCALQIPTLQPSCYEHDALTFELKAHWQRVMVTLHLLRFQRPS